MRETGSYAGTRIQAVVDALDGVYAEIELVQKPWRDASPFPCSDGCGSCCVDFEPDVLECEALYLACWMLFHQRERALSILDGSFVSPRPDPERGCILFDPANPYHCTVYGGRCLICRLFGYTGDRGKDGGIRWKPCRFLPAGVVDGMDARRQYRATELHERFGAAPVAMGDITAQISALVPDSAEERLPLREALPRAIAKILMLERFIGGCTDPDAPDPDAPDPDAPDPDAPEPNPESPMPRAS
jgi:Fe-S-cluster containining protein